MELASLTSDFNHASIQNVTIGPRREVMLEIAPLVWNGSRGRYADGVRVRFGGIENFAEVSAFFAADPHKQSELAELSYADGRKSKPGRLFVELVFERIDARLVVQCSSVQVGSPPGSQSAEDMPH